jgi:hypothetical protein
MKMLAKYGLMFSLASALCLADTWSGKLVDAACKMKNQQTECSATKATKTFGIELADGKVLPLDAAGNAKAGEAVKNSTGADLKVSVTGSLDGNGGVKVETIDIQQ